MNELETLPKAEARIFLDWVLREAQKYAEKEKNKARFEKWLRRREKLR